MESRHVGWIDSSVYGFCFCATSVPHHNLTTLLECVYHQQPNCAVTPQRRPTHSRRFPLSLCRSPSLLFHYVMLWQASLERLTGARWGCVLNVSIVCVHVLGCGRILALHAKRFLATARAWRETTPHTVTMLYFLSALIFFMLFDRDWNKIISFCWESTKHPHTALAFFMFYFLLESWLYNP